jgi:hypothetical protein
MRYYFLIIGLIVLLSACSQQATPIETAEAELSAQANSWRGLGYALDSVVSKDAINPKLLLDRRGRLVVAWEENNNGPKVYIKRWSGSGWQRVGKAFPLTYGYSYPGFSLVFDSTNSPVIGSIVSGRDSYLTQEIAVHRFDNASRTWKQLGTTFKGSPNLTTDKNGTLYSVLYDNLRFNFYEAGPVDEGLGNGKNIIRRWNGNHWESVQTYQAVIISSLRGFDVPVDDLSFKHDGTTLVIKANTDEYTSALSSWNGSAWQILCYTYRGAFTGTILDRNDRCFGENAEQDVYQGSQVLGSRSGLKLFPATFDRTNHPIVAGDNYSDVVVQRWSGSDWDQLGGILDRISSREAYLGSLVVDDRNRLYAAWTECATYDTASSSCTNRNIYVSRYVP